MPEHNRHGRWSVWCLPLALCCAAGTARAIPAPVPDEQLEASAHAIVEGTVISVTYLRSTTRGSYTTAQYRGKLKVQHVSKGDLKPGAVLPLRWGVERWVGKGPKPPGRGQKPAFSCCERARVYLFTSRSKKTGKLRYHVSAKRLIKAAPSYVTLTAKNRTVRCAGGKPARR